MPQSPMKVCGEVVVRIHHHLMSMSQPRALDEIRRVFSHGQSLAQCHEWLNAEPAEGRACGPWQATREAARRAAGEPGSAAVAGETAAEHYGLAITRLEHRGRTQQHYALPHSRGLRAQGVGTRQDLDGPFGEESRRRGVRNAHPVCIARRVDVEIRIAAPRRSRSGNTSSSWTSKGIAATPTWPRRSRRWRRSRAT